MPQAAILIQSRLQLLRQPIHKILRDAIPLELAWGYKVGP
jgi:hypothetical protein